MKSAFRSKRKARRIGVEEDLEDTANQPKATVEVVNTVTTGTSTHGRKTFKKSSLRQSIAFDDLAQEDDGPGDNLTAGATIKRQSLTKPTIGRSNSSLKKKGKSSHLSFGPNEIVSGDADEALEDDEAFTPTKVTLRRRIIESDALSKDLLHFARSGDDGEQRPTYSKDYLNELRTSTPNTPKEVQVLGATVEDEVGLDVSELAGATIVDIDEKFRSTSAAAPHIPSEAEIREKKERRARLAQEKEFISLNDHNGPEPRQLSLLPRKKNTESRLVREDEDIAEGFDDFVEDGRISLGTKQERESRRRQRKEMAALIQQAEGSSDDDSDDSEAERRAAYEAAQTRSGMDGLSRPKDNVENAAVPMPSRITPLPSLSACLERLQNTLQNMEHELVAKRKRMADLEREKKEIVARETEVQDLLKQAGARYAALKADTNGAVADPALLLGSRGSLSDRMVVDRGLESFGNTPTIRPEVEDVG